MDIRIGLSWTVIKGLGLIAQNLIDSGVINKIETLIRVDPSGALRENKSIDLTVVLF